MNRPFEGVDFVTFQLGYTVVCTDRSIRCPSRCEASTVMQVLAAYPKTSSGIWRAIYLGIFPFFFRIFSWILPCLAS